MARRISDTERITQFFMENDLAVAENALHTASAIVASRRKLASGLTSAAAPAKRERKSRRAAENAAMPVPVVEEAPLATDAAQF